MRRRPPIFCRLHSREQAEIAEAETGRVSGPVALRRHGVARYAASSGTRRAARALRFSAQGRSRSQGATRRSVHLPSARARYCGKSSRSSASSAAPFNSMNVSQHTAAVRLTLYLGKQIAEVAAALNASARGLRRLEGDPFRTLDD